MSSPSLSSPSGNMNSEDLANFMDSDEPIDRFLDDNEVSRHSNDDHQLSIDRDPTPRSVDSNDGPHPSVENSNSHSSPISTSSDESQRPSDSASIALHPESSIKAENSDDLYAPASPKRKQRSTNGVAKKSSAPVPTQSQTSSIIFPDAPSGSTPLRTPASTVGSDEDIRSQETNLAVALDVNDNEEVAIIERKDASPTAKRRWEEPVFIDDDDGDDDVVFVKKELKDTPSQVPGRTSQELRLEKMMAAQRALIFGGSSKDVGVGSSRVFGSQKPGEVNDSRRGKKRRWESQPIGPVEDRGQVDAAMRDDEEDHSWMEAEVKVDEEYVEMQRRKAELERRERSGKITNGEAAEFSRLINRLKLKDRLRAAATAMEDEREDDSLFVPESREETACRHRRSAERRGRRNSISPVGNDFEGSQPPNDENEDAALARMLQDEFDGDGLEGAPTEKELAKTKKPRKKAAKTAREWNARHNEELRQKELEKERKKELRKKGRPAVNGKKKDGGKAVKPAKKGKGKGKGKAGGVKTSESLLRSGNFNRQNGADDIGQMILEDLMNNDPIADRLQDPVFATGPAPEITGKQVKTTQLQRLIANIPEESNVRTARDDKLKLRLASQSFGYAKVKAVDGKWLIKGMKSTLYHHQLLGAQWMVSRELSAEPPHGGLLADSMGLGKTVQMLACMVGNPPTATDKERGVKSTLIVVPGAVIDQWLEEIGFHAEKKSFPKVMRYKASAHIPLEVLQDLDIVVTSYTEVMKQFPFPDDKARQVIANIGYKKWWADAVKGMGDLHNINWYRVVLDEAHAIKNNSARTSLACQNLKSVYRWCLTGTPLLNRLEELFPYLRFLKANYSMDWNQFQKHFCDPTAEDCHSRIAVLLSYTMMRRTMKTTILNRPIIILPKPHPYIKYVTFSPEEKVIYRITENRFRANLNTFFAAGTAGRNYGFFMVQLLRLRQCTSHPFMLERTIKESWTAEDVAELNSKLTRLSANAKPFYEQCKVWVEESEAPREAARARGESVAEPGEVMPFGRSDFGRSFELDKALTTLSEKELYSRVTCSICSDVPIQPTQTSCGHIFCKACLTDALHIQAAEGNEYQICPRCDRLCNTIKSYRGALRFHDDDEVEGSPRDITPTPSVGSSKRHKNKCGRVSKGRDALGFEPHTKDSTWITRSDYDDEFPLVPSAKTAALKALLLQGFSEAPTDKVVIYVQFRLLARIVGRICEGENWGFLYLTGDASFEHRTKVVKKFRNDEEVKILIAGLKCGGLGLNFPWANRCISLDLWWNHAVEQQAFGRIFRIGQNKETHMTRIVVRGSVDMRLLTMQMHKLQTCDKAMRDDGKEPPNLSLNQLANLFGFLRTDEDDKIISIEADYDDDADDSGNGSSQGAGGGLEEL